jgi:hypothetical protein
MKVLFYIITLIVVGFGLQLFLPWWSMPLAAAVLAILFGLNPQKGFISGFLGAALLWGCYAAFTNLSNEGILASQMGQLFGGISGLLMVLVTTFFGGLFGGLGALVGSLSREL